MSIDGLDRAARASRGKRMSNLLDEEADADDEFWNQDAFKDDAEDNEYATEDEEADVFDSDFDEDEADEEEYVEEDEREPTKKRKLPPGHQREKKKDKTKKKDKKEKKEKSKKTSLEVESFSVATPAPGGHTSLAALTPTNVSQVSQLQENGETIQDVDGERSIRKSTRTAVVIKQAEREAHQAALQALSRPVSKKKKEEERKISQEEMLLEAAQTEIQNVQALEVMLAREEEVKRKAVIQKIIYAGPQIRFHSKDGVNILEFTKVDDFPPALISSPMPYPKKALCVITGLPARYRDPKTGLPYATKEAFRAIREKYNKRENPSRKHPLQESHQRKRTKVERERSGSGDRRTVTKLKYKKIIGMITGKPTEPDDVTKPIEPEVQQNTEQSVEPDLEDPVDLNFNSGLIGTKNSIDSLHLSRNLMTHDLASLDMPEAFVETNEADFMLDDLEVSNPSTLG